MYRDLERNVKIGNVGVSVGLSNMEAVERHERLDKAVKEFTDKKGKEVRKWTKDNIEKRIEAIEAKYGEAISLGFVMSFFQIYRHSSEFIHGTIFGAMFNLGFTELRHQRPTSAEQLEAYREGQITLLISAIVLLLSSIIFILSEEIDLGDLKKENQLLVSEFHTMLKKNK
jgi:hypothetical protein